MIDWADIVRLSFDLCKKIRKSGYAPDCIVTLLRGGLVPARIISDCLNVSALYVIGISFYEDVEERAKKPTITQPLEIDLKNKKVLIVDDVADTGKSIIFAVEVLKNRNPEEIKIATLHKKPWSEIEPDFYIVETDAWVVYPWEFQETLTSLDKKIKEDLPREEKIIIEETLEKIKKKLAEYV